MQVSARAVPSPDVTALFSHSLAALGPFGAAPHLAVALSGGADSMALALLADAWARAQGGRITTLTVDHALRPESRAEAEQVGAWMHARGIAHHILTPAHTPHSNNLQEAARQWRYDALADWCRAHDVLHCLIAHHADDQRETVAHNLARGTTADGTSGMACARNYRGIRLLRPLLGVEKEMLTDYLHTQAAEWIEDPSNSNLKFARVRTRDALAADSAKRAELTTLARREGQARAARDTALAHAAASLVTLHPEGRAELPLAGWLALPPALASQLLADLLTTLGDRTERPRRADTERLCAALHQPFRRRTLHGCLIALKRGALHVTREHPLDKPTAKPHITPAKPLAAAPFWWFNQ